MTAEVARCRITALWLRLPTGNESELQSMSQSGSSAAAHKHTEELLDSASSPPRTTAHRRHPGARRPPAPAAPLRAGAERGVFAGGVCGDVWGSGAESEGVAKSQELRDLGDGSDRQYAQSHETGRNTTAATSNGSNRTTSWTIGMTLTRRVENCSARRRLNQGRRSCSQATLLVTVHRRQTCRCSRQCGIDKSPSGL